MHLHIQYNTKFPDKKIFAKSSCVYYNGSRYTFIKNPPDTALHSISNANRTKTGGIFRLFSDQDNNIFISFLLQLPKHHQSQQ